MRQTNKYELASSDLYFLTDKNSKLLKLKLQGQAIPLISAQPHLLAITDCHNNEVITQRETCGIIDGFREKGSAFGQDIKYLFKCQSKKRFLKFTLALVNKGPDCVFDVKFILPVVNKQWQWAQDINESLKITGNKVYESNSREGSSIYPLGVIYNNDGGLCLATSPYTPLCFNIGYKEDVGFYLRYRLGLIGGKNIQHKLSFMIYAVDGQWNIRDAFQKYYAIFPQAYRTKVDNAGLWLFASDISTLSQKQMFGFYESGAMHEYNEVGHKGIIARARQSMSNGVIPFRYTIPGQKEVEYLPKVPTSLDEALEKLHDPKYDVGPNIKKHTKLQKIKAVEDSCLYDKKGQIEYLGRETFWAGNAATFVQNPDPRILHGKLLLQDCIKYLLVHKCFKGIYIDSLYRWGAYKNYRREHLKVHDGFTSHDEEGDLYIYNWMSHFIFLRYLHHELKEKKYLLFGNGIGKTRMLVAAYLDVLGTECGTTIPLDNYSFFRVAAGNKPYLLLTHDYENKKNVRQYLHRALLYGLFPSFKNSGLDKLIEGRMTIAEDVYWKKWYERDKEFFEQYVPILRKMHKLGWQPVTLARVDVDKVYIERFGKPQAGKCIFTIYNDNPGPVKIRLQISGNIAEPGRRMELVDISKNKCLPYVIVDNGDISVKGLTLSSNRTNVLELGFV